MLTRRDFLKLSGAGLIAASLSGLVPASAQEAESAPFIWHGSTRHRYVALTYDDCNYVKRLQVLEKLLAQFPGFKITLFPIGTALLTNQVKDPGIWKRYHDQGHDIGYHSWKHDGFGAMSPEAALDDYAKWLDALTQVLGFTPTVRFARVTGGDLPTPPSFEVVCQKHKLINVHWSTGWGGPSDDVIKYTVPKLRNGDIILMHSDRLIEDIATSEKAYPWMKENDWTTVTLSKLYDDLLLEQNQSLGCDVYDGPSLTRTCIE